MKKIMLTRGQVTLVDDEDFEWLSQWKWCARKGASGKFYAARSQWDSDTKKNKTIIMARVIVGAKKGEEVDHKNGNTLDNRRRYNLRLCTPTQNRHNVGLSRRNTSGYKGVAFRKNSRKWEARMYLYLGSFNLKEEAARAYDKKAIELFGEFAKLNFPRRVARE